MITILLAYFSSACVGAVVLVAAMAMTGGISDYGMILYSIFVMALVFGAPVALPVIIATEIKRTTHPATFALAGVIVGIIVSALFFDSSEAWPIIILISATTLAALTYWLIAWRMMPPKTELPYSVESTK